MSVDRTENKNDRKGLAQVGYCLKYLMNFLRPYKGGLVLGLLMVVVANITFAVMPVVEGEMTTQLFSDGEAILKGVEGAHVHFDVIFGIMGTLVIIYIIKTVSQLITAVFLTRGLAQGLAKNRGCCSRPCVISAMLCRKRFSGCRCVILMIMLLGMYSVV